MCSSIFFTDERQMPILGQKPPSRLPNSRNVLPIHAIEMSFRTAPITQFGARPTRQALHFRTPRRGETLRIERIHAKGRHRVSPNGDQRLFQGCRQVHHARIVCKDQIGLRQKGSRLLEIQLSAKVADPPFGKSRSDPLPRLPLLLSPQQKQLSGQARAQFQQLFPGQTLGGIRTAYGQSKQRNSSGTSLFCRKAPSPQPFNGKTLRFGRNKVLQTPTVVLYAQSFGSLHITLYQMALRQKIPLETHQQPLAQVQLRKGTSRPTQMPTQQMRTQIVVQIHHKIIALGLQSRQDFPQAFAKSVQAADVWIGLQQGSITRLGQKVQLNPRLFPQRAQNRRGEHDVSNGRKANDQNFFQKPFFLSCTASFCSGGFRQIKGIAYRAVLHQLHQPVVHFEKTLFRLAITIRIPSYLLLDLLITQAQKSIDIAWKIKIVF